MRCNICNKDLTDKEVSFNEDLDTFEPCGECLEIIYDTAFGQGYNPDDDRVSVIEEPEEDISDLLFSSGDTRDDFSE